ncbi:hypothetical protein H6503_04940 [Candidatus Woesearchaeota archaeon]|nr:hypothetical protein [Candidatus Woesearchaeota archaeon]
MFRCNHNGRCCEDPTTQISLTLGDIWRLCKAHKKSALDLYKEGIIGVFPFGDPFKDDEFETDIGLFVPCKHRIFNEKMGKKICSVYEHRPINCRLFPIWILAEAPMNEIMDLVKNHQCGECCGVDEDFEEDRKIYQKYKGALVEIIEREIQLSDPFYESLGLKKRLVAKKSNTQEDDLKIVEKLVADLQKEDFSEVFIKIDDEIKKHEFEEKLPAMEEFL